MVDIAGKMKGNIPLQLNTGPLQSFQHIMDPTKHIADLVHAGEVELFFHMPFAMQLYQNPSKTDYVAKYVSDHMEIMTKYNLKPNYIFHSSYPTTYLEEDYLHNFQANLVKVFGPHDCVVLIENLVGSNRHPDKWGSVQYIADTILAKAKSGKFKICLDTEHMRGAGDSWRDLSEHAKSLVGFIHLNGWPKFITSGCRTDLHSYTPLRSSWDRAELRDFLTAFADIPMVFERRLGSVMADDYIYTRRDLWTQI